MKTTDFLNKAMPILKEKYFKNVRHGIDENPRYYKCVYAVECYHNGCFGTEKLIIKLSRYCKDTKENINFLLKDLT